MSFRSLPIRIDYAGRGQDILDGLVLPVLSTSCAYDRITSFFSTASLVAIAAGLDRLWQQGGQMRLILGMHDIPPDLLEATSQSSDPGAELITLIRQRIISGLSTLVDELSINRLSTMAWMIQDGLLSVKVASLRYSTGQGIFHNKVLIFKDENDDQIAAVGSPNETASGLGANFEHLTVFNSWEQPSYVAAQTAFFDRLWNDEQPGVRVHELDAEFAKEILEALPNTPTRMPRNSRKQATIGQLLDVATEMPAFSMMSGGHTALFPHQESVFIEGLSRWPIRVMLSDEVGLGKTFETGAIVKYIQNHLDGGKTLILAPKAVVLQWQSELSEHFGIDAWVYESGTRSYTSSNGEVIILPRGHKVFSELSPQVSIVSAQLARGSYDTGHIFADADVLPNLLVVDEAHAARVNADLSGIEHPTLMWRMLNDLAPRIPHLIFATATPMQTHWREYHALLELLGLPEEWAKKENYRRSLDLMIEETAPAIADCGLAARLIRSSLLSFAPLRLVLTPAEQSFAQELTAPPELDLLGASLSVRSSWPTCHSLLVKTHPARFLTVRNTRTALENLGYQFPLRDFPDCALDVPNDVKVFYERIHEYLRDAYFEVEKIIYPDRRLNTGFVKCAYQQRLASSLAACQLSLQRRRERVSQYLGRETDARAEIENELDEISESDVFDFPTSLQAPRDPDLPQLLNDQVTRAVGIELRYIDDLLAALDRILEWSPDPKLTNVSQLIDAHISRGDRLLVFSRYTDTLDAVIRHFRTTHPESVPYAIYTGKIAEIDFGLGAQPSSRSEIRNALAQGAISIVFCSDAASEGLNLQAARVLVNVDVPWNPARLEQRIGRVARLGQLSNSVDIYNLWYPDSIEAKIYSRLLERRDLFQIAVGEFPDVVGTAIRDQLDYSFSGMTFTSDPIAELNRLQNNIQIRALRQLWLRDVPRTFSQAFREQLGHLASAAAQIAGCEVRSNDCETTIQDSTVDLTFSVAAGNNNVISLQHPANRWLRLQAIPDSAAIEVLSDARPAWFAVGGTIVDPKDFLHMIERIVDSNSSERALEPVEILPDGRPSTQWLPDHFALQIPFTAREAPAPPAAQYISSLRRVSLDQSS